VLLLALGHKSCFPAKEQGLAQIAKCRSHSREKSTTPPPTNATANAGTIP
jgi:hypothetical protein